MGYPAVGNANFADREPGQHEFYDQFRRPPIVRLKTLQKIFRAEVIQIKIKTFHDSNSNVLIFFEKLNNFWVVHFVIKIDPLFSPPKNILIFWGVILSRFLDTKIWPEIGVFRP